MIKFLKIANVKHNYYSFNLFQIVHNLDEIIDNAAFNKPNIFSHTFTKNRNITDYANAFT